MFENSQKVSTNKDYRSFMDDTKPEHLGGNPNVNPFAPPPDEKIFTFKEEEKQRRLQEREKNRKTKIWNKNRPAREGCLKRL